MSPKEGYGKLMARKQVLNLVVYFTVTDMRPGKREMNRGIFLCLSIVKQELDL